MRLLCDGGARVNRYICDPAVWRQPHVPKDEEEKSDDSLGL